MKQIIKSQFSDLGKFPHSQGGKSLFFKNKFHPSFAPNPSNTKLVRVYTPLATQIIRETYKLKKKAPLPKNPIVSEFISSTGSIKAGVLWTIIATKGKRDRC